ncbi:hypothetical protein ACR79M_01495 [Sphingobacterium spiritivorum]|uniref:hypothetical protein n=1 Tax=Sphingobacterium spiritivorum TaxID=258 RepID=UPI003DA20896
MELQLKIIGILLILLAGIHIIFPRYFNWKQELKSLNLINRQMMSIHTLFIAIGVFLMGLLCYTSPVELVHTALGRKICLGLGIFWFVRLIVQFSGYSTELWKGKKFETTIHITFCLLWIYLSAVFLGIIFIS